MPANNLAVNSALSDGVRRVVLGLNAADRAIVLFDSSVPLKAQGPGRPLLAHLWITEGSPAALSGQDDLGLKPIGFLPPAGGTKLGVVEFPPTRPEVDAKLPTDFMMKVVGEGAPTKGLPPQHPMMHRTRTVDYAVIISGEIDLMLDDTVLHLTAGDVVVQQATNHAWVNREQRPCRILFILVDAMEP